MKILHPVVLIVLGMLLCSLGFNVLLWQSNRDLIYRLQKLEAGPARGLFNRSDIDSPPVSDEEHNKNITELLRLMREEQKRRNTI